MKFDHDMLIVTEVIGLDLRVHYELDSCEDDPLPVVYKIEFLFDGVARADFELHRWDASIPKGVGSLHPLRGLNQNIFVRMQNLIEEAFSDELREQHESDKIYVKDGGN